MRKKVMISSTLRDMEPYRESLERALKQNGFEPVVCENKPPAGRESPVERSIKLVNECEIFLCVIAERYGTIPIGQTRSYTEIEFDAAFAHQKKIPILVFVQEAGLAQRSLLGNAQDVPEAVEQLQLRNDFVERIKNVSPESPTVAEFTNKDNLAYKVLTSLTIGPPGDGERREFRAAHSYDLLQTSLCGRDLAKAKLDTWLSPETDYRPICMIEALGGMGKSALAWTWARARYSDDTNFSGAFWYSFYEETANYEDFIRTLAAYIRGDTMPSYDVALYECQETCAAALKEEKLFLILDGFEATFQGYSHTTKQPDAVALDELASDFGEYRKIEELVSFRKIGDPRISTLLASFCAPDAGQSRVLLTTRYLPADLQQATGAPISYLYEIFLEQFSFEETKQYWRERGLLDDDPDLERLHVTLEGWPLALAVASGSISRGQLIADFYRRHPDFDPFREGATRSQRRNDVFKAALAELSDQEEIILKALAAFRFPLKRETLVALLQNDARAKMGEDSSVSPDEMEMSIDKALDWLQDRKLIGYDYGRLSMHPVVRHVVRSRGVGGSMNDLIGTAQSVPIPALPKSVSDLELHIGLTSLLAERNDFREAILLLGAQLNSHLRRLEADRERLELYGLFFEITERGHQVEIEWLPSNNDVDIYHCLAGQSDFSLSLSSAYEKIGRPDIAVALHRKHVDAGMCRDPMCDASKHLALKALGRLSETEQSIFRCIERTKSAKREVVSAHLDWRQSLTRDNYVAKLEQVRREGYILEPISLFRMNWEICDYNIEIGRAKAAIGYLYRMDDLVRKEGYHIHTIFEDTTDYLTYRNLLVAKIYRSLGLPDCAIEITDECLAKAEANRSIKHQLSGNLELAHAYLELGDHNSAISRIERYRDLRPADRGTVRDASALVTLADCRARAHDDAEARRLIAEAKNLAASGMDRSIVARATLVEAQIARLRENEDQERDLLIQCLKEFRDPSETNTPMLFSSQREAVQRLKEIGHLSEPQRRLVGHMRRAKAFRPVLATLKGLSVYATGLNRPPINALWQL